ncbi:MAG: hypothetical protein AB7G28_21465 [Pirellulales bacterium]
MTRPQGQSRQTGRPRRFLRIFAPLLALAIGAANAAAREQADEFLAGLRERGLYDQALDYLEQMESSPLSTPEFRERIPYHRGVTLIAQARQIADVDQRTALFEQASRELEGFVSSHQDSPSSADAVLELANVMVDQAKQLLSQSGQIPDEPTYAEQRDKLRKQARGLIGDAEPKFHQAEEFYVAALDGIPKSLDPKTQSDLVTKRQEYRGRLAQVRVLAGQAEFEAASTYPPDSDEFMKRNAAAAEKLARLHEEYSKRVVGIYAQLYEGRCYQAVGDYQRALGTYEAIVSLSNVHPALRKIIASAYAYQSQCLVAQGKPDAAIGNLSTWLNGAEKGEAETAEWLFARFQLAESLRAKADAAGTKQSERRSLVAAARDAYRAVAKVPNEYQGAALAAAIKLGPENRPDRSAIKDFAAAYQAGKDAMGSVNAAKQALPSAAKNNPAAMPELRLQAEQSKVEARDLFRLALSLVDDDTNLEQLNEVRYFLCWLDWESGDYFRAAVLGDFLARRYPDHPAASASAKLALASYEQLMQAAQAAGQATDTEFESRQMADIADYMARRWPGTPAAETAQRVLVSYAIRSGKVDEAKALFDKVPAASRPALEAQLGNALWGRYLQLSQQQGANKLSDAELAQLRGDATKYMQSGFDAAQKSGQVSEVTATSGLYLAQMLLADGKPVEALALLEAPKVGPLTLVRAGDTAAARPEFVIETYKAALRALVGVTPPKIEQAVAAMQGLEAAVEAGGGAQGDQVLRIYVALAKGLSDQLTKMREAGQTDEVARLSGSFGKFLDQVSRSQQNGSWATRYWIAQAYFSLGQILRAAPSPPTESKNYFTKARDAFARLADEAEKNPAALPTPVARLAVAKQLGECYRELGEYQKALDAFSDVLADQEAQLTVQQAAAEAYQRWGTSGGGVPKLERAIFGGYQLRATGKNRIWGWLKLAQVAERAARSDSKYEDVFFEARLEAARCRYLIGTKSEGAEREKNFTTAKQSIRSMLQLYPDLGGDRWREAYENLLKQIQKASGESPKGLAEFAVLKK